MQKLVPEDLSQLFSLLMDTVPIGMAVIDRDLRLQYINAKQAKLNGFSVSDHIDKKIAEVLPQAAAVIEPKIQFVLDTGLPLLNQEIRGSRPANGGPILHRMASYFPWKAPDGSVKGVLALVQDSSMDDFSRRLLEISQQRLLKVLDNLFAFVGVMELDGTVTDANKAPLEAAGLVIDDVRGKKVWDCYWFSHDSQMQQQLRMDVERCRTGEIIRYDLQVRMINDSRMWIDFMLAPLKDEQGHITHLIPSAMDISQRHAGEIALHRSEERFHSIVDSSDDAIITKSLDGIITGWNPAACRLLGYSVDEAIGRPITMFFPESRLFEEEQLMQKISRGERVPSFETVRIHKSGRLLDLSVTVSPLRDRNGVVIGACKLARDISVQKHQRELIEHALEEKTALLHEVHHRVKNNLQIVTSLLNLQARKVSPDAAKALAECQARIRAMALVHQLLYESSSMAEVDLSDYMSRLVALTKATYDASASDIQLVFSGTEDKVTLDIQRAIPCGLVVNELVLNAVKHAFPAEGPGRIDIQMTWAPTGLLHLSVSDNGCGLPADFAWGSGGTGLGTQLIPLFINQLHAHLITESTGSGSRFTIELNPDSQRIEYES